MKRPPAPFGLYCVIAVAIAVLTNRNFHWHGVMSAAGELAGIFVISFISVALVGEIIRAIRYRKGNSQAR
jgi:hypothetical protein